MNEECGGGPLELKCTRKKQNDKREKGPEDEQGRMIEGSERP
jgi:hypothetical protein